jgi:hypothetical protein
MAFVCVSCAAGFGPLSCLNKPNEGCFENGEASSESIFTDSSAVLLEPGEDAEANSAGTEKIYRDPVSTGRKRAATLYPLKPGMVCEWAFKRDCGGGIVPIVGCTGRPASHIHHGPDKSTFNNDRDNISLICEYCHNRWHAANDLHYVEPRPANGAEWLPSIPAEGNPLVIHRLDEAVRISKAEALAHEMLIPEGGKDAR